MGDGGDTGGWEGSVEVIRTGSKESNAGTKPKVWDGRKCFAYQGGKLFVVQSAKGAYAQTDSAVPPGEGHAALGGSGDG